MASTCAARTAPAAVRECTAGCMPYYSPRLTPTSRLPALLPRTGLVLPPQQSPAGLGALRAPTQQRGAPCQIWPFDQAWDVQQAVQQVDQQALAALAPNLFAVSLLPYIGFLYHLRKATNATRAPPLIFAGFTFLLAFVFATIPAGIYAKQVYGTTLANVDWLHGSAESLLTVTNLLIVLGLRKGIRQAEAEAAARAAGDQPTAAADSALAPQQQAVEK